MVRTTFVCLAAVRVVFGSGDDNCSGVCAFLALCVGLWPIGCCCV